MLPRSCSSTENQDIRDSFGNQYVQSCSQWRHVKCSPVIKNDRYIDENKKYIIYYYYTYNYSSNCHICLWCKHLLYSIQKKRARIYSGQNTLICFSTNKNKQYNRIKKSKKNYS